jgi:hypothetical protein
MTTTIPTLTSSFRKLPCRTLVLPAVRQKFLQTQPAWRKKVLDFHRLVLLAVNFMFHLHHQVLSLERDKGPCTKKMTVMCSIDKYKSSSTVEKSYGHCCYLERSTSSFERVSLI